MTYNPLNWYWIVSTPSPAIYSSKRRQYVSASDEGYLNFVNNQFSPTYIDTEESLFAILSEQNPEGLPDDSDQWRNHLRNQIHLETERRVNKILSVTSPQHGIEVRVTALQNVTTLLDKVTRGELLTPRELFELDLARIANNAILTIRQDGIALENAMDRDFRDDHKWRDPTFKVSVSSR